MGAVLGELKVVAPPEELMELKAALHELEKDLSVLTVGAMVSEDDDVDAGTMLSCTASVSMEGRLLTNSRSVNSLIPVAL